VSENAAQTPPSVHSVAVAVMRSPAAPGKLVEKDRDPPPAWVTFWNPAKASPSPFGTSTPDGFLKNSTRYDPAGTSSEKFTMSDGPDTATAWITGKLSWLFGPASPSRASLPVTPSPFRSMPVRPLRKIWLPRNALPVEPVQTPMPSARPRAQRLPAPGATPPTRLLSEPTPALPSSAIPAPPLPSGRVPEAVVPT